MRENDLVAIIRSHRRDSLGSEDGALSNERAKALDHYHGRLYGNEMEGRSAVVSKDLSESVDWVMPAIMRIFTQSGNVGEFEPVGPEDEMQAQQESDYINKVVMQDNSGFLVIHDWFKDALLLKNGYVKHWWDETETIAEDEYCNLSIPEVASLISQLEAEGAKVDIVGQEEKTVTIQTPQGDMPVQVFDVRIRTVRKEGRVRIEAVPTEEIRISRRCRGDTQTADFVEHVTRKTRSQLIEMGMKKSFVYDLPAFAERDNDQEVLARDSVDDESNDMGSAFTDRSMDEIEYCEAYIRVDWDGDGIAELRKVVTVSDRIPDGDEWNEQISAIPITGCVPKRIPHRHVGESLDDDIADLQEIKTTLLRQMLDNVYLTNNNQWLVNERVNLTDFMQSTPGGVKRVRGLEPIAGAVEPVIATPIVQQVLPVVDYFDNIKEARTGINRATTGLDPDILKQTTKGAFMENLNRASQKVEMIARMLAETGVKPLLMRVHELLIKHSDKAKLVQMRGQYVQVNPQEWRNRNDLKLKVGLGTGNEEEKRQKMGLLTQLQDRLMPSGLVGPNQMFQLFADMSKAMGFDLPEKYAMNPSSPEFQQAMAQRQQQAPNPLAEAEKIKGEFAMQRAQMEYQFKSQAETMRQETERMKNEMEMRLKLASDDADRRSRELIEAAKLEFSMLVKGMFPPDIGAPGMGGGLAQ